jgi:hypothetical protein
MEDNRKDSEETADANERPMFLHQPWMVGLILGFAVLAIMAGLSDPIWLFLGAPFILVLVLYIYVQIKARNRKER